MKSEKLKMVVWKRKRLIAAFSLLVFSFSLLVISSCVKESNYSVIPNITYKSFTPFCSGSITDSAYLQVNFTDGDGDIGYAANDATAPFDFFAIEYINHNGTYVPFTLNNGKDTINFSYHIPDITPAGKNKSLNGIIQINFENAFQINTQTTATGYNFYQIEFQVWIFDRAGHKSNAIMTPPLTICQ